jgi:hypothetical protein
LFLPFWFTTLLLFLNWSQDAIDVYVAQRRKQLEQMAKDPQLAALLAARGIDLVRDLFFICFV